MGLTTNASRLQAAWLLRAFHPDSCCVYHVKGFYVVGFAVGVSIEFETNAKAEREKYSELAVRDSTR
jgi:hypothetical protein